MANTHTPELEKVLRMAGCAPSHPVTGREIRVLFDDGNFGQTIVFAIVSAMRVDCSSDGVVVEMYAAHSWAELFPTLAERNPSLRFVLEEHKQQGAWMLVLQPHLTRTGHCQEEYLPVTVSI